MVLFSPLLSIYSAPLHSHLFTGNVFANPLVTQLQGD